MHGNIISSSNALNSMVGGRACAHRRRLALDSPLRVVAGYADHRRALYSKSIGRFRPKAKVAAGENPLACKLLAACSADVSSVEASAKEMQCRKRPPQGNYAKRTPDKSNVHHLRGTLEAAVAGQANRLEWGILLASNTDCEQILDPPARIHSPCREFIIPINISKVFAWTLPTSHVTVSTYLEFF